MNDLDEIGHPMQPGEDGRTFVAMDVEEQKNYHATNAWFATQSYLMNSAYGAQRKYGLMTRMFMWISGSKVFCEVFYNSSQTVQ